MKEVLCFTLCVCLSARSLVVQKCCPRSLEANLSSCSSRKESQMLSAITVDTVLETPVSDVDIDPLESILKEVTELTSWHGVHGEQPPCSGRLQVNVTWSSSHDDDDRDHYDDDQHHDGPRGIAVLGFPYMCADYVSVDSKPGVSIVCKCVDGECQRRCCWASDYLLTYRMEEGGGGGADVADDDNNNNHTVLWSLSPYVISLEHAGLFLKMTRVPAGQVRRSRIAVDRMRMVGDVRGVTVEATYSPRAGLTHYCNTADGGVVACRASGVARDTFYVSLYVVAIAFAAATLATYALCPSVRNNNYQLIVGHTVSCMLGYIALTVGHTVSSLPAVACKLLGYSVQLFFLCAFFWLNVMCVDIARAFYGLRPMIPGRPHRSRPALVCYCVYAWGCPMVISAVTVVMDTLELPAGVVVPAMATPVCWFGDRRAVFAYFYGPIGVLLLVNLLLFCVTARNILVVRRSARRLQSTSRAQAGARLSVYVKLFLLMGVSWLLEVSSWYEGGRHTLWKVTDALNILMAMYVFFTCCWRLDLLRRVLGRAGASHDDLTGSGRPSKGTSQVTVSL